MRAMGKKVVNGIPVKLHRPLESFGFQTTPALLSPELAVANQVVGPLQRERVALPRFPACSSSHCRALSLPSVWE